MRKSTSPVFHHEGSPVILHDTPGFLVAVHGISHLLGHIALRKDEESSTQGTLRLVGQSTVEVQVRGVIDYEVRTALAISLHGPTGNTRDRNKFHILVPP